MKTIIISEHDGWTWRVEAQEGCDDGVDLIYEDHRGPKDRICLGSISDARQLARAILAYTNFMDEHGDS